MIALVNGSGESTERSAMKVKKLLLLASKKG